MDADISAADLFRTKHSFQKPLILSNGLGIDVSGGEAVEMIIPKCDMDSNMRSLLETYLSTNEKDTHVIVFGVSNPFIGMLLRESQAPYMAVLRDPRLKFVDVANIQDLLLTLERIKTISGNAKVMLLLFDLPLLLRHARERGEGSRWGGTKPYMAAVREVLYMAQTVSLGATPIAVTLTAASGLEAYKVNVHTRKAIASSRMADIGIAPLVALQPT